MGIGTYSSKVRWSITLPLYLVQRNFEKTYVWAESIRTSLQRLEIGIPSVSAHESCVFAGMLMSSTPILEHF